MISRARARAIAESALLARGDLSGIALVADFSPGRAPRAPGGPSLEGCWVAYIEGHDLDPAAVVLIDRQSGRVSYVGGGSGAADGSRE
ncbi:MAG: hypothetical protein KGL35_31210 [Bradyrhizobium sp.]|nr:hypothetical protein [Bradyrhizobium sp.]